MTQIQELLAGNYLARWRYPGGGAAYIGVRGVCLNGKYHTWDYYGGRLERVELMTDSPCRVEFDIVTSTGDTTSLQTVKVPVPAGREQEAGQVMARFHGE